VNGRSATANAETGPDAGLVQRYLDHVRFEKRLAERTVALYTGDLQRLSEQLQCEGPAVGMMTAASLASLRVMIEDIAGERLAVLVTTGLENARSAGDLAEHRSLDDVPSERGTINLAIVTSAQIADAALVEMVAIATEAKTAELHALGITSPLSGRLATGTGTDAIAVFSGHGAGRARFAGKHTLLGERLAVLVMQALHSSVNYTATQVPSPCA